jgi:hypothetical protein
VNETHKRNALNAVASAAASAKRWGLNAFQRRVNDEAAAHHGHGGENASKVDLSQPMGRGHPLPPPGTPLPMPEKKTPTAPIHVPKRKPIPSPVLESSTEHAKQATERSPKPPPLPTRRQHQREQDSDEHNMLVVAAPADSEPTTPLSATHNPLHAQPWAEEAGGSAGSAPSLNPEDTIVAEHIGLGVSPLAAVADEGQPKAAGTPEAAADDEDYSAWMDEMEMEDPSPPSSTQPDKVG